MFLFDPALGSEWGKVEAEVNRLMERCGARVIMWGKWDERRLAYPIKQHKRAVYVLVYFQADADKIVGLERDVQLSEVVLRSLVLRADHVSEEQMSESIGRAQPRATPSEDRGGAPKDQSGGDDKKEGEGPPTADEKVDVAAAEAPSEDAS